MILLADIGGSHFRYAFIEKGKLGSVIQKECDCFQSPIDLLDMVYAQKKFSQALLAVAGPVEKGKVCWTNRKTWTLSESALKKRYHLTRVKLYNDMQAQGYALSLKTDKKSLLMNIGTGCGCCFLNGMEVLPCEFGLVLDENNHKKEEQLSASGIVRLYHQYGGDKKITSAKMIDSLRKKRDKNARQAYEEFYRLWGKTAGNLATGLRINTCVYLWGGLAPKTPADMKLFLKTFYHKKYPNYLHKVSVKIIKSPSLTFKGLMNLIKV